MKTITITGKDLTIPQVVAVARDHARVVLDPKALDATQASRDLVEKKIADNEVVYGVTTGFGQFKSIVIPASETAQLQRNLIRSHAIGVGEPFAEEVVRGAMLVRLNSLMVGHSGVRRELLALLAGLLNADIYPYVPQQGSVGSSGDLAPLSHLGLVLMGEGEVWVDGKRTPTSAVLAKHDLTPIDFAAKEGLAFNNGTSFMTAVASLAVADAMQLAKLADLALALTLEGVAGLIAAFDPRVHALRPYPGQGITASNVRQLVQGSNLVKPLGKDQGRVQDAYSLRCSPQVHGAARELISFATRLVETELNSVTDNPLIFPAEGDIVSGGNFHGEPVGMAMDVLKIAVAELSNISERRMARLLDPATNEGLPAFLIPAAVAGVSSGYMIAQYTAASLVSEMKVLAHPATVDSIPTSANQEDHVSMGTIASRHARQVVGMATQVLGIEIVAAVQAIGFRKPVAPGKGTAAAVELVRSEIPQLTEDRILYPDQEKISELIRSGALLARVEKVAGALQ